MLAQRIGYKFWKNGRNPMFKGLLPCLVQNLIIEIIDIQFMNT